MIRSILAATMMLCSSVAFAEDYWPKDAEVYFIEPADNATIKGPVTVKFGLKGLGVAPAGVIHAKTGHHHLFIDVPAPSEATLLAPIPMDEGHRHFGGGQTETKLVLSSGKHTLQLVFGDAGHVPHDPPLVSDRITIDVK